MYKLRSADFTLELDSTKFLLHLNSFILKTMVVFKTQVPTSVF